MTTIFTEAPSRRGRPGAWEDRAPQASRPARPQSTARLRARKEGLAALAREMGWAAHSDAAADLGVSATTLDRALSGRTAPGERLIAAVLAAIPRRWRFEDLFEVVDEAADGEQ